MTGKIHMALRYGLVLLLAVLIGSGCSAGTVYAEGNLQAAHDDGSGNVYGSLDTNYVQITNMSLNNAVILSGDVQIITGQPGVGWKTTSPILVYRRRLNYGTSRKTLEQDAKTAVNQLPSFSLKFPSGAVLADGTPADVILSVDELTVELSNSFNTNITSATTVYLPVFASMGTAGRSLFHLVTPPKTSFASWDHTSANYSSGATVAMKIRTTIQITEHAEGSAVGAPIDAELYPSMLVGFYDLDVRDNLVRSGASYTDQWNGAYAEGVELVSGWNAPVALAPESGDGIQNECLLDTSTVNGNLRLKGAGRQFQRLYDATGSVNDDNTYYSGMIASADPQGFTYYWTGSCDGGKTSMTNMGTILGGQPTVAVRARYSEGGTLEKAGLNSWQSVTYLMNSSTEYRYQPEAGYQVQSVVVDGVPQELTEQERKEGGTVRFPRLNKYPLPVRSIVNGSILNAEASGFYTLEVSFEPAPVTGDVTVAKQVKGNLGDHTKQFDFTVEFRGLEPGREYMAEFPENGAAVNITAGTGTDHGFLPDDDGCAVVNCLLKSGQEFCIRNLPAGCGYRVSEAPSDHRASYELRSDAEGPVFGQQSDANARDGTVLSTQWEILDPEDGNVTVWFCNERELAPVTGSRLPEDPGKTGAAWLLVIPVAGIPWLVRRRILR